MPSRQRPCVTNSLQFSLCPRAAQPRFCARFAAGLLVPARSARAAVLRACAFAGADRPLRMTLVTPFGGGGDDPRAPFATLAAAAAGAGLRAGALLRAL